MTAEEQCRDGMEHAVDYASWREAALELDHLTGRDEWKAEPASPYYDHVLIRDRYEMLRRYREAADVTRLVYHLRQGLHWNLGNIGNPALYQKSTIGTKTLIEDYVDEVIRCLNYLCDNEFPEFSFGDKVHFFEQTSKSFGRSALMLSGGVTFGLFHIGVLKALYEQGLLPRVISGSSAGAIVAASAGTRRPEQLPELFEASAVYANFWKSMSPREAVGSRSLMDQSHLKQAIDRNIRDLNFEEAFETSGRITNITVSPVHSNQIPRLLNYLTFPYLFMREAVLASCAVPLVFPPVQLQTRDAEGKRAPFMPSLRWADGSLKSDLPRLRLRRLHNVNHYIVSQTNPHVLPFLSRRESKKAGVLHDTRRFALATTRYQFLNTLKLARDALRPGHARHRMDELHAILDQDYRGNVTILPKFGTQQYLTMMRNPSLSDVQAYITSGERATWPRIAMIRTQIAISQAFDDCDARLRAKRFEAGQGMRRSDRSSR